MEDNNFDGASNRESAEKPSRVKIVIAEDDELVTGLLKATLTDSDITFFTTAEDALEELRKRKKQNNPVDLVITDVGLEGDKNGGFVLAEQIAEENLSPSVFFLTGNPNSVVSRYNEKQRQEMGIERVIGKPVSPLKLMGWVGEVKSRKQDS